VNGHTISYRKIRKLPWHLSNFELYDAFILPDLGLQILNCFKGDYMRKAQNGDNVRVHFSAYHDTGTQFATTLGEKPLKLTIGDRKLIDCFEQSIVGMVAGEKKTVSIDPNRAMGERRPELVTIFSRESVPEQHEDLKVGSKVEVEDDNGNPIVGTVTHLTDQKVTVDTNHPLAGKTLIFEIELIEFL
jgi:peptidylprolyl isomerase